MVQWDHSPEHSMPRHLCLLFSILTMGVTSVPGAEELPGIRTKQRLTILSANDDRSTAA